MRISTRELLIALIILSFIIGWFAYFERERRVQELVAPSAQLAIGLAVGEIQSYRPELYISPWSEDLSWIKEIDGVEGIKVLDKSAVLLLNRSPVEIRALLKNESIDAEATATIAIAEPIDFLLANGTRKKFPIAPFRVRLDPITPIGEKITLEITAEISDIVENFRAEPKAIEEIREIVVSANNTVCTQNYSIELAVPWSERELAPVMIANITENFTYERNDSIYFGQLNETQLAALSAENLTYIIQLGNDFAIVNITDKEKVISDFAKFNISITFPSSTLTVYGNETIRIAAEAIRWDKKIRALCFVNLLEIDNFLLKKDIRSAEVYLSKLEGRALLKLSRIGRLIHSVEVLHVE